MANDQDKAGQQGGTAQNNPGNFAKDREKASEAGHKGGQASGGNFVNDPQRASEAGQKGGQMSGGDLRINKPGMAAAVTFRKMILRVPVAQPNGVAREAITPALNLTGRKVWTIVASYSGRRQRNDGRQPLSK